MTSFCSRFTSGMGAGGDESRGAGDITTSAGLSAAETRGATTVNSTDLETKVSSAGASTTAASCGGKGLLRAVTNVTVG